MRPSEIIIYSRKSRQDDPNESVEEVLAKHERILQDFCRNEYGFMIPEENIYREVCSGESIESRVAVKEVLRRVEDKNIRAVLVIEPQRLSRGDLVDCGTIINILQYTDTVVITPTMTYDMSNKMERRFFQDELMRGRDYLEYVKEILNRGKLASVQRGCYLPPYPPYGYDRVKIGKDNTLTPNKDADTVRMIFRWYDGGMTSAAICRKLEAMGIKSPTGRDKWPTITINKILRNQHYIGKITYKLDSTTTLIEDGEKIRRKIRQQDGDYICVEGKHPAIIDRELFDRVRRSVGSRTPLMSDAELKNLFAGLIYCGRCGRLMSFRDKGNGLTYIRCRTKDCCKYIRYPLIRDAVLTALEEETLPELTARAAGGDDRDVLARMIRGLERELADLKAQEEMQYELLETRKYTQELFDRRNTALRDKMAAVEKQIREVRSQIPSRGDLAGRAATLSEVIAACKEEGNLEAKNALLKSVIDRIDVLQDSDNLDISIRLKL